MAFSRSRKLANIGKAIDSGVSGDFLGLDDSGGIFKDVQWNDITGKPTILDSAATIAIIDSAYVQARQTDVGIDSAQITNLIDSAYVQLRVGDAGLDSAAATGIIDSAYVAARVTAGLDSAGTLNLVDSDYISNRASASSGFEYFKYIATAGQTVFDSTDEYGNTLSYGTDNILVFYNGVLMLPTYDYTTSGGTTVTLNEGADSGIPVTIGKWAVGSSSSPASGNAWQGARGLFGGYSSTEIQYITIASPGNATDFGDLSQASIEAATGSNGSRIVFAGGSVGSNSSTSNVIEYVTSSSTGNATDFGDLTQARFRLAGASNGTYSLFAGGSSDGSTKVNTTDRITVATTGNATDFGDMQTVRINHGGASDATRAIFFAGNNGLWSSEIDYFTFATASNATDFGDALESEGGATSGTEDGTYAVFVGAKRSNVIQYITVQTTGNAADFGDMTVSRDEAAACSDGTYGVFAGGYISGATNVMDYVTIASTGNATDFGDLISAQRLMQNSGASGAAS